MKFNPGAHAVFLLIFSCLFILINVFTLKDGHNWGGDFSQYLIHAANLLYQQPYDARIALDFSTTYAPGFPAILAGIIYIFGFNFFVLKFFNIIYWLFYSFIVYLIFRAQLNRGAAFFMLLFLFTSPFFFCFKQSVLSDIPFLFFCTSSLYFFHQYFTAPRAVDEKLRRVYLAAYFTSLCMCFLIRNIGITVFIAAIFYVLFVKRNLRIIFVHLILLFLCLVFQNSLGAGVRGYLHQMPLRDTFFSHPYDILLVIYRYFYSVGPVYEFFLTPLVNYLRFLAFPIVVCLTLVFLYRFFRKRITIYEIFSYFYLLVIIVWGENGQGPRYILPLIAFIMLFSCQFIERAVQSLEQHNVPGILPAQKFVNLTLIFLIAFNTSTIQNLYHFDDDVLNKPANRELFTWVQKNVSVDEPYTFSKARVMRLLTDRVGTWLQGHFYEEPDWRTRVHRLNIKYIILTKVIEQHLITDIQKNPHTYERVWENSYFEIYQVLQ